MKYDNLLLDKTYIKNPDRIIPTKVNTYKTMYNMFEVANITQDTIEKTEKRTTMDITARFLDSISYALVHHWDKLQDPRTRLANFCMICATVNVTKVTTPKLEESRKVLFEQTGYVIKDGEFVEPVK